MFNSHCTKCGTQMQVPSAYRDKPVHCLTCRKYFLATPAEQLPFEFPCPICSCSIEAERGWAGMPSKCPTCKLTIQIPEPPFFKPLGIETIKTEDKLDQLKPTSPNPSSPPPPPKQSPFQLPAQSSSPTTKPCPMCGEQILATAKKCKHCGEIFDASWCVETIFHRL